MRGSLLGCDFRPELPGIDPIPASIRQIDRDGLGTGIGAPQTFHQDLRIGGIGKGADLHP